MGQPVPQYEDTRITKVKRKDDKTTIKYESFVSDNWDKHRLTTKDDPHPDFTDALQALAIDIAEICEVDYPGWPTDNPIEVRSVSFSHKHEVMGAVLSGVRHLKESSGPLNLTTPHKIEDHYSEHGDPFHC